MMLGQVNWVPAHVARAVVVSLLFVFGSMPLLAREEILEYDSVITVLENGTLDIVETIVVNAEGINIRRGIFRDFPTRYKDNYGNNIQAGFEVVSVRRNGRDEPYQVSDYQNGKRVRIGSGNQFLDDGLHTYELRYSTTWQITHLAKTDELYFNAIGHGWDFPIQSASVSVRLPEGAAIGRAEAYAGSYGSRSNKIEPTRIADNELLYELIAPLARREGLTVLLEWPTGIVSRPSGLDDAQRYMENNRVYAVGIPAILLLILYFAIVWYFVGRDPKAGLVIAQYEPPKEVSPGLARFIWKMGTDYTAFNAALINMAVKGYHTITQKGARITLQRTGENPDLSPGEKAMLNSLYRGAEKVSLGDKYSESLADAYNDFSAKLSSGESKFFNLNSPLFYLGVFLAFAAAFALFPSDSFFGHNADGTFVYVVVIMASLLVTVGFTYIKSSMKIKIGFKSVSVPTGSSSMKWVRAAFIFGYICFLLFTVNRDDLLEITLGHAAIMTALFSVCLGFSFLIPRRTFFGQKVYDHISGFRHYLEVAEKDRLNFHNPPELTPKVFERCLPYAIALGVENEWGEQFDAALGRTGAADSYSQPNWYSGTSRTRFRASSFSSSVSSGLSTSIAAAATPPSSSNSSGFSGGGFSGGGGGGGGGGGW